MVNKWNIVKPERCKSWLVLPTVYSDALSYGEQLDKFCYQLNKLTENNNILPDFIVEVVKQYIESGEIGEIVSEMLSKYILNVKYPPLGIEGASGDGTKDDTLAIQGCIDYAAENGGVVYFPYGSYLTDSITIRTGVSLFGFDRYSTKLVLKGGAKKPLISGNATDFSLINLTLDANINNQVTDVNVITLIGSNVLINNLIIKNGFNLLNYNGTGGNLQIDNVIFGDAGKTCLHISGNTDTQCNNIIFNSLSGVSGVNVVTVDSDNGVYNFKSVAKCDKCLIINGNGNKISAIINNANTPYSDNGLRNNINIYGDSKKEFYLNSSTEEIEKNYSKHVGGVYTKTIDGDSNESVGATYTKTIDGDSIESVGATYTKTIDGDSNESVGGAKNIAVTGVTTETYTGDRTVTNNNFTENTNGKKVSNFGSELKKVKDDCIEILKNKKIKITNEYKVDSNDFIIDSNEPVTYKKPTILNDFFKTIPFKDYEGEKYSVLVRGDSENFEKITGINNFKTIFDFGAVGDGVTDDYNAFQMAYDSGDTILIPPATYNCSKVVETKQNIVSNFIINSKVTFNNVVPLEINDENTKLLMHATPDSSNYNNYEIGIYKGEGGTRGTVLSTHVINSIITSNTKNFVWGLLSILNVLDNITNDSENVGVYSQVNGSETSDTGLWGGCFEINDYKANPKTSKIGMEITYRSNLSDNNHSRHALHISLHVKEGATGGNISSGILITGNNDANSGPITGVDTGLRFEGCEYNTLIGGGRTGKQKTKANYGIDFGNFDIKKSAIRIADKILEFLTIKISEYDNILKITNGKNTMGVTPTPESKTDLIDSQMVLPVNIDGQQFYLKLYR